MDKIQLEDSQVFKVIFLGETGIGKSSIIEKFCSHEHIQTFQTHNIEFGKRNLLFKDSELYIHFLNLIDSKKINIFKLQDIRRFFYKNVNLAIIMFDLTVPNYVETINRWTFELEREKEFFHKQFRILCLGTKADLKPKEFSDTYSETLGLKMTELSNKFNQEIFYFEVSSQDCNSCSNIMHQIEKLAEIFYDEQLYT